jgi:hypothetical protein
VKELERDEVLAFLRDASRREEWSDYVLTSDWRDYRRIRLREADLSGANLNRANLMGADLSSVNLRGADLRGAQLGLANLYGANLYEADLRNAFLARTHLLAANLSGANLSGAFVGGTDLSGAELSGAKLSGAKFSGAKLSGAKLSGADLSGADLSEADLSEADLSGAVADSPVLLGATLLISVDLSVFCRSPTAHEEPSSVDFRSIVLSLGEPRLKEFLRKTGMPDVFVEYNVDCARSLSPEGRLKLLQSTFISYGGPDEAFARKLNEALQAQGVTTFFFKDHAPPGEKLHRMMRTKVNSHDRVILVCSASALERPGVVNELEETLAREARDGGATYLLPITLDKHVFASWKPSNSDVSQAVRDRVIADFSEHEDREKFDAAIARLIGVLKKPLTSSPP